MRGQKSGSPVPVPAQRYSGKAKGAGLVHRQAPAARGQEWDRTLNPELSGASEASMTFRTPRPSSGTLEQRFREGRIQK